MKSISVLALSCLLLGLAGCGNRLPEPEGTAAPTTSTSAGPTADPTVEPTVADPADPSASPEPSRTDATPDDDLTAPPVPEEEKSAAPASFGGKITYKDGTTIEVTDVKRRAMTAGATVSTGKGKAGAPFYLITIKIENKTTKTLVAAGADTMTLPNGDIAKSVVDQGTRALGGKIAPGASRDGSYGYVIPANALSDLKLEFYWDNDSDHAAATFEGSLKTT